MGRFAARIDLVVGVALSIFGVVLVSGLVRNNRHHAGAAAAALVLMMTLPVVWRRRVPVVVAVVLGAGSVLNLVVIGPMVRCGPALPALLLCAYSIGRRPERPIPAAVGLAALLGSATVQSLTDPQLNAGVMVAMGPMIIGSWAAGRLVESRTRLLSELARRNDQLRQRRARRSELAVLADRGRIADGLETGLRSRITAMGQAASAGRRALQSPEAPPRFDRDGDADAERAAGAATAQQAFASIQITGRETLTHMRQVVGTLLGPTPHDPEPSLSQLDVLMAGAGRADIHLHVTGRPTVLPAGIEVSAYRTLEHLLDAYGPDSGRRIDVAIDFTAETLTLAVRGPIPSELDVQAALASAQARVDVLRGSLVSHRPGGRWETTVRLPLGPDA